MTTVSGSTVSRSSAPRKTLTAFSKLVAPEPAPAPGTFANTFVKKQCVAGLWYPAVHDTFSAITLSDQQQLIEAVWMQSVCKALVAAATPPAPAQELLQGIAEAARDALNQYEAGDKSAFANFITIYPTIASFPHLKDVSEMETMPDAVEAACQNYGKTDSGRYDQDEKYVVVDLPATESEPATRWVISPVRTARAVCPSAAPAVATTDMDREDWERCAGMRDAMTRVKDALNEKS